MEWYDNLEKFLEVCRYERFQQRVSDEGRQLGNFAGKSQQQCEEKCDNLSGCQSFGYQPSESKCWLFDKALDGNEPEISYHDIYTVYKKCGKNWKSVGI